MDLMVESQPMASAQHGMLRGAKSMPMLQTTEEEIELKKTKSTRVRPAEMMDSVQPGLRGPLKDSTRPREVQPRSSKLSLFHLFSKPKVERMRGYTEKGVQHPTSPSIGQPKSAMVSESGLSTRSQNTPSEPPAVRPTSSKTQAVSRMARLTSKERIPSMPRDRKSSTFSPPPLFQAYPQATKHGVLEIPAVAPDAMGHGSKAQQTASQHVTSVETIRKIFVLITSGYLLQYAYDGPSDRHPEKILELGNESAAFACDLLPGQHFVLQVSHAVNRHGIVVPSSSSLLTRLGLRGNTSRRMISNCWLILTAAEEMDSWMIAIRHEIEILGGNKSRGNDTIVTSKPEENTKPDLRQLSSPSHRYQLKRDPSKVLSVVSPVDKVVFSPALTPSVKVDDDSVETATIDDIEVEASTIGHIDNGFRTRATSDTQSSGSSTAHSLEQQQLEKIRNSIQVSHASSLITGLTSGTNSPTLSHLSDFQLTGTSQSTIDSMGSGLSYQSLSSHATGDLRSAALMALSKDRTSVSVPMSQQPFRSDLGSPIRSPVADVHPLPGEALQSPPKRLTMAQSVPNLKTLTETKKRHDSKLHSPETGIVDNRPESVLGELPSPSVWAGKPSPTTRHSTFLLASGAEPSLNQSFRRAPSQSRRRPNEMASFSLPLKINGPDQPSARSVRRASQAIDQADVASPVPVVHTLTAKVDLATRTTISTAHIPPRKSSTGSSVAMDTRLHSRRSANSRLSLFPAQPPPFPSSFPVDQFRRSPSISSLSSHSHAQTAATALKRPTSMQVRSNHAPFLSSVRNSTQGPAAVNIRPGTTVPIRSLKPSRSSVMMHPPNYSPSEDPFYEAKLASFALAAEASDQPSPLPSQLPSPSFPFMQSAPMSLTRRPSRIKSRTLLELGMPLAALGPPAPPPQAPLPELPTASKPSSPIDGASPVLKSSRHSSSPQFDPTVKT